MSLNLNNMPTVLAVDDSAVMQTMIKKALDSDYQVLVADNAVDALALIYHQPISILLLDVSMPGVDGLELCRTVRSLPQFRSLPIIMLTARDGVFDKVQGRLAGANEYLTKPFDAEQLRQVVKNSLSANNTNPENVMNNSEFGISAAHTLHVSEAMGDSPIRNS